MANAERRSFAEKVGIYIRNGGIVAGIIGLLAEGNLAALGFLAAVGGELLRSTAVQK